jgi:predicted nucleic acid-binding protein
MASERPSLVVIDTNWALDLWVFEDPAAQALRVALDRGDAHWVACLAMREELERVLDYPAVRRRREHAGLDAAQVLSRFDAVARLLPAPPPSGVNCRDRDDQVFIDLAVQHHATLLSKDAQVLALKRRLASMGLSVRAAWP